MSYLGYSSEYLSNIEPGKELIVTIKPFATALAEVKVQQGGHTRKQKMQLFREHFLGTTTFGKKTIIKNEDDLYFKYDKVARSLKAFSDKPLLIYNSSLGYMIIYELVNFEAKFNKLSISSADVSRIHYAGLSRFEDTDTSAKVIKARAQSFQGSQLQFFRNLVNKVWDKDIFLFFKGRFQANPSDYLPYLIHSILRR